MENYLSNNNIEYKAQNSKEYMFIAMFYNIAIFCLMYVQHLFNLTFVFNLYLLFVLFIISLIFLITTVIDYYSCALLITKNNIISKTTNSTDIIEFANLKSIKKYRPPKYVNNWIINNAFTLIKFKNGNEIRAVNIKNLQGFVDKIKDYYPEFNNPEQIISDIDEQITNLSIVSIFIFVFVTLCADKLIKHSTLYANQIYIYWTPIILLSCVLFYTILRLFNLILGEYILEQKNNVSLALSQKNITNDNVITNFCPICGDQLQNYKCDRCFVTLDNIYQFQSDFCMKCGTPRENSERICTNCGLKFKL